VLPVVIVDLFDHAELVGLVQAALSGEVVLLPIMDQTVHRGAHAFELRVPGLRPVVLLGEPNGDANGGMLPVRLRPFDDAHAGQLLVLACSQPSDTLPGVSEKYSPGRWQMLSLIDRLELDDEPLPADEGMRLLSTVPHVDGVGQAISSDRAPRTDIVDPLVGRVLAGKYSIEAPLGAGATGIVYSAQQIALRRPVAVKVMRAHFRADPSFAKRFHAEALAASKLDNPNVLRVLDFGEEPDGLLYIVMELLRGREMRALLNERTLGRERELEVMAQVCSALMAAHERGIVHRDIKPENVVVASGFDDEGKPVDHVKVCDFGLATIEARRRGADDGSLAASAVNLVAGTPQYMAPEQVRGERLDARADLYAVGVMLFEIATRRLPFDAESVMDVVQMQLYTEPPRPRALDPRVDPRLETIILKALSKNREARYQSARDLRADVRALLDTRTVAREERTSIPIANPEAGFMELFITLTTGIAPTGGIRDEAERERVLDRLFTATRTVLTGRGEVTFVTRAADARELRVQSGMGERSELRPLVGATAEPYVKRLIDVLSHHEIASISLREGVSRQELGELVRAFETGFGPREVGVHLRQRTGRGVVAIFASDLVGTHRSLPRGIDLALTRVAIDLAGSAGAALAAGDGTAIRSTVNDTTANLSAPELKTMLDNVDLVYGVGRGVEHLTHVDARRVIIECLSEERCAELAMIVLDEHEHRSQLTAGHEASLGRALAEALVRADDPDTYPVVKRLYEARFLSLAELPVPLQEWADAELVARELERDAVTVLSRLQAIPELAKVAQALERVRRAMRVLAQRESTPALWATAARLRELSGGVPPGENGHEALAARAADTIREPEVLASIAEALLVGSGDQKNAGIGILRHAGSGGARALLVVRQRLAAEQAARARFVAAMRAVGDVGVPVVAEELAQLAAHGPRCPAAMAEDLLRALPEHASPKLGPIIAEFTRHESAAVRRGALAALAGALGHAARDWLLQGLMDTDDGVRIAALNGLRQGGVVDQLAVSRIDRILNTPGGASDDLKAAAAGALMGVVAEARPVAIDSLRRALRPVRMSFISMLKDGSGSSENVLVVTTIARTLLALAGPLGRTDVEARARASRGDVKKALLGLLGHA
jgi:serine/threonine protein kinase